MLEQIVTLTDNPCVSLLYPEGQLFPRIFLAMENDTILGAMPSFMLNVAASKFPSLASVSEHMYVRMRDGTLLTSMENAYWQYVFDLKLNTMLNHASSKMVFRRGLEFLLEQDGSNRQYPSAERTSQVASMPMDEAEATRRVKELACLLKKGSWTYFMTITCNDLHTPGVRIITKAIQSLSMPTPSSAPWM